MAALKVGGMSFEKRYDQRTRALLKTAATLPDRPSPDQIHDLRVAVRRIQTMRRLMPRRVRVSADSKRYDLTLKSVLKATSQLRDMDTLVGTLESHKGNIPVELLVSLENERSDAAARAKAAVRALVDVPAPDLGASRLRGKRLSRRLRKRARKQSRDASALLTAVLSDESKVEELHSLRKEVKKMRYLLELADKAPARISSLTKWQEALGSIHDLDVAVSYLEGADASLNRRAILELQRARHSNYLKFVRDHRADLMRALGRRNALPVDAPTPTDVGPV